MTASERFFLARKSSFSLFFKVKQIFSKIKTGTGMTKLEGEETI
jgi:hypothetical protein